MTTATTTTRFHPPPFPTLAATRLRLPLPQLLLRLQPKFILAKDQTIRKCENRKAGGTKQRGLSYGPTNRVRGGAKMGRGRHANPATGAFGGAPYGATN
eukprot:9015019-Pyramimonas_sp.AAC.1